MIPRGERYDLSQIRYVKRIVIGTLDPQHPMSDRECEERMALLNKCLNEPPKGTILSLEKAGMIYGLGEQQVAVQQVTYHVGFQRKPYWLKNEAEVAHDGLPFALPTPP